jgi:hypothetical protein
MDQLSRLDHGLVCLERRLHARNGEIRLILSLAKPCLAKRYTLTLLYHK